MSEREMSKYYLVVIVCKAVLKLTVVKKPLFFTFIFRPGRRITAESITLSLPGCRFSPVHLNSFWERDRTNIQIRQVFVNNIF
jgi:hypothetical protein